MIELDIQTADREPRTRRQFHEPVISIGRDPTSTLSFDMGDERDVSTRHAEIRQDGTSYVIVDRNSTNGTFVNGGRISEPRILYPGDVINLGRGPEMRVRAIDDWVWHETVTNRLPPMPVDPNWQKTTRTQEWRVAFVAQMRTVKYALLALAVGTLGIVLIGWLYVRRMSTEDPQVWREVTAPGIRSANDNAVALVETQIPVPNCSRGCEGTGFSITDDGLIVTNRHVVVQQGAQANRVRVRFANTRVWIPAHVVTVANDADLALVQVDAKQRYPEVGGVSTKGVDLPVGAAIVTVGFPLGTALKMEGTGASAIARTTMTTGSVNKVLTDEFQIDAFADHGSSGSPVFDRHGHVIGVISKGARDDNSRIVYVVPSNRIADLVARKPSP